MGEENEVVTYFSESRFEDSIETICEIVLILLVEFTEEYQFHYVIRDYAREQCFEDPSLSPKAVWVTQVFCFTLYHHATVFGPPSDEKKSHMKPLNLTTMVEDQIINKIQVDGGATINILPKSMKVW